MPTVETTHGNIFYTTTQGDNPPLILIHGAASSHLSWGAALRRFPMRGVVTLDLPGHGKSVGDGYTRIEDYAGAVVGLMDALNITEGVLVGHSMGGAIAQMIAVQHPQRVTGLVLIGTGKQLPVTPKILDEILVDPEKVAERITRWEWAETTDEKIKVAGKAQILEISPSVAHGDFMACRNFSLEAELHGVKQPTLIFWSNTDKMTPAELTESLAAALPHAELIALHGAGHMMPIERDVEIAQHIEPWLTKMTLGENS